MALRDSAQSVNMRPAAHFPPATAGVSGLRRADTIALL